DDDRNDEDDSPRDHLGRRNESNEDGHDDDSRNEVEEVPHDNGDRQGRAWELEALDHRRTGPDRSGASRHRFSRELKEEDSDDEEAEEVVDASRRIEDEAEDEPEGEHREQGVEEQPAVAEKVLPRRPAHLRPR